MRKNLFVFMLLGSWIAGAQGKLEFTESSHSFGEIKEEDGPAKHVFRLYNSGNEPVKITNVSASCGCTTPAWTREEIMPGDSGFITAEYNPLNRPGEFKKSLTVTSTGSNGHQVLHIDGYVKPRPRTIEDELPTKIGALRLKYRSFNFGKITTEKPVERTFEVYNDGQEPFSFLPDQAQLPGYITVVYDPMTLKPEQTGEIKLTFFPEKRKELGFFSEKMQLFTTEPSDSAKDLFVVATVEEYFPPMTEDELAKAPRLAFDKTSHDFGDVRNGSMLEVNFTLINNGKNDLNIRDIQPNCECTVVSLDKEDIAPGKEANLKVSFDTSGRRGRQYKTITIFSNDPTAPTQMISLRADVGQ